jgi:hypothetical protein
MATDSLIGALGAAAALTGPAPVATLAGEMRADAPPLRADTPAEPTIAARLSSTGKLLARLLDADPAAAARIPLSPPLLPEPTDSPRALAEAVRHGLVHSGLFYESHLADWVEGERTLEAIRREPQAQSPGQGPAGLPEDAPAPLILRQQLEILDGQPLQWQGELWPGLPLQLAVRRERQPPPKDSTPEPPPAWQTTLASTLPALGDVVARLRIDGDRLQLAIRASDSATAALMSSQAAALRDALAAAGLQLQSFSSHAGQQA